MSTKSIKATVLSFFNALTSTFRNAFLSYIFSFITLLTLCWAKKKWRTSLKEKTKPLKFLGSYCFFSFFFQGAPFTYLSPKSESSPYFVSLSLRSKATKSRYHENHYLPKQLIILVSLFFTYDIAWLSLSLHYPVGAKRTLSRLTALATRQFSSDVYLPCF